MKIDTRVKNINKLFSMYQSIRIPFSFANSNLFSKMMFYRIVLVLTCALLASWSRHFGLFIDHFTVESSSSVDGWLVVSFFVLLRIYWSFPTMTSLVPKYLDSVCNQHRACHAQSRAVFVPISPGGPSYLKYFRCFLVYRICCPHRFIVSLIGCFIHLHLKLLEIQVFKMQFLNFLTSQMYSGHKHNVYVPVRSQHEPNEKRCTLHNSKR